MSHPALDIANSLEDRVKAVVEEILSDPGLFIVEVTVRGVRGARVVEIYIDGDEPVGVNTLAGLNREIGFMLDAEDFIDGRYQLLVSSPGLDRPLALPRQFSKQAGRRLRVKLEDSEGTSTVEGDLLNVTAEYIELGLPGGDIRRLSFDEIQEARIVLPW